MADFDLADYISVREAAQELGRSPEMVRSKIYEGTLGHIRIGTRYYIPRPAFERYKAEHALVVARTA